MAYFLKLESSNTLELFYDLAECLSN